MKNRIRLLAAIIIGIIAYKTVDDEAVVEALFKIDFVKPEKIR
mgnify:CR=1 FL=1